MSYSPRRTSPSVPLTPSGERRFVVPPVISPVVPSEPHYIEKSPRRVSPERVSPRYMVPSVTYQGERRTHSLPPIPTVPTIPTVPSASSGRVSPRHIVPSITYQSERMSSSVPPLYGYGPGQISPTSSMSSHSSINYSPRSSPRSEVRSSSFDYIKDKLNRNTQIGADMVASKRDLSVNKNKYIDNIVEVLNDLFDAIQNYGERLGAETTVEEGEEEALNHLKLFVLDEIESLRDPSVNY